MLHVNEFNLNLNVLIQVLPLHSFIIGISCLVKEHTTIYHYIF